MTLQRRELALFKLIETQAPQDKVFAAGERVRAARIRAINAKVSADGPRAGRTIYDAHIDVIREMPVETILGYFGYEP